MYPMKYINLFVVLALSALLISCTKEITSEFSAPLPEFDSLESSSIGLTTFTVKVNFNTPVYSVANKTGQLSKEHLNVNLTNSANSVRSYTVEHIAGESIATIKLRTSNPSSGSDPIVIKPGLNIYNSDGIVMPNSSSINGVLPSSQDGNFPDFSSLTFTANGNEQQGLLVFTSGVYSTANQTGALDESNFDIVVARRCRFNSGHWNHSSRRFWHCHSYIHNERSGGRYGRSNVSPNSIFDANGVPMLFTSTISQKLQYAGGGSPSAEVSGELTGNITWNADTVWYLNGHVRIAPGATLNIEPGTIIKGRQGSGTDAGALYITKGAQIFANGTETNPIVFTTELDNIQVGQVEGTNLSRTDNNMWAGVIILGDAPISPSDNSPESVIEGVSSDEDYGKYGGTEISDNSGEFTFVSIRYGGVWISEGQVIDPFMLGGVGDGTTIHDIEVYSSFDDGISIFGGSVDMSNLLILNADDDGIDVSESYDGTITNFLCQVGDGIDAEYGVLAQGPEGTINASGMFTLQDGTVRNQGSEGKPADFRAKAQGAVRNVSFSYQNGQPITIRASFESDCTTDKEDAYTHLAIDNPTTLNFVNCAYNTFVLPYTLSEDGGGTLCPVTQDMLDKTEQAIQNGSSTGADESVFSWTLTSLRGEL
jgi:hypothetical protein